jgi:hypothetical protein
MVRQPLFGLLYQRQMTDDHEHEATNEIIGKGNQSTLRKPAPMLLCPTQIPNALTRAQTEAAKVGSRRLAA